MYQTIFLQLFSAGRKKKQKQEEKKVSAMSQLPYRLVQHIEAPTTERLNALLDEVRCNHRITFTVTDNTQLAENTTTWTAIVTRRAHTARGKKVILVKFKGLTTPPGTDPDVDTVYPFEDTALYQHFSILGVRQEQPERRRGREEEEDVDVDEDTERRPSYTELLRMYEDLKQKQTITTRDANFAQTLASSLRNADEERAAKKPLVEIAPLLKIPAEDVEFTTLYPTSLARYTNGGEWALEMASWQLAQGIVINDDIREDVEYYKSILKIHIPLNLEEMTTKEDWAILFKTTSRLLLTFAKGCGKDVEKLRKALETAWTNGRFDIGEMWRAAKKESPKPTTTVLPQTPPSATQLDRMERTVETLSKTLQQQQQHTQPHYGGFRGRGRGGRGRGQLFRQRGRGY